MAREKSVGIGFRTDYTAPREEPLLDHKSIARARGEDVQRQKARTKIANMLAQGVTEEDVATLCNVPAAVIQEVKAGPEYLTARNKEIEKAQALNKGWDAVEALAIRKTVEALEIDDDPNLALKAAQIANNAKRRNTPGSDQVQVGRNQNGTPTVIINLPATYAQELQEKFVIDTSPKERPKKVDNSLTYDDAVGLLQPA